MQCLTVVTRSLLANHYDPFFEVYKGDYAELYPERIINYDCKPSCILPVTQAITKHNTSGELIAMDHKTSACVSLIHSFGRHMPVGPSGIQFSAVYGCYQLAKHTVLAGFQFDPGGYLHQGFVFDPSGFISNPGWFFFNPQGFKQLLKSLQAARDVTMGSKA